MDLSIGSGAYILVIVGFTDFCNMDRNTLASLTFRLSNNLRTHMELSPLTALTVPPKKLK